MGKRVYSFLDIYNYKLYIEKEGKVKREKVTYTKFLVHFLFKQIRG